jgi:hypothetical protein
MSGMVDDVGILLDLRYGGDKTETLRSIAKLLRSGEMSQMFRDLLADQIDPDRPRTLTDTKLVIARRKNVRPRERRNSDLIHFIEVHRLCLDEKHDAVLAAAMVKFGVPRSTCNAALKEAKALKEYDPELFERSRAFAVSMRNRGDPDFMPVR